MSHKTKFPSTTSLHSKEPSPTDKKRRSSADGLRDAIFNAICDRKIETDLGALNIGTSTQSLNAPFSTPTFEASTVSTSTPIDSEPATSIGGRQSRKLRRSISFDEALNLEPIAPKVAPSYASLRDNRIEIKDDDKSSIQPSECPSDSEMTSEVASIASKEPEPVPLSTYTQLLVACAKGGLEKVEETIEKYPQAVKYAYAPAYKYTPLHMAVKSGSKKLIEYLISKGADVNAKSAFWYTPLHMAAMADKVGVVEYLIKHGADQEAIDASGYTFLHYMSVEGKEKMKILNHKKVARKPSISSVASSQYSNSSFLSATSKEQAFGSIRMGSIRKAFQGLVNTSATIAGYSRKKNTSMENLSHSYSNSISYSPFNN